MKGNLRIVGRGLHRQIATIAVVCNFITGEARQIDQGFRPFTFQAKAIVEQAGAETEGQRQLRGRKVQRIGGIGGRLVAGRCVQIHVRDRFALRQARGRIGPFTQQRDYVITLRRGQIEYRKISMFLRPCGDACLMSAEERLGGIIGQRIATAGGADDMSCLPHAIGSGTRSKAA